MKEIYIQQPLNEFFEEFKNLPYSYKIEQVHQLLNNPNAKATHKVNFYYKPLKLIIMTSIILISISTLFLTLNPGKNLDFNPVEELSINKNILPSKKDIAITDKTFAEVPLESHNHESKELIINKNDPADENIVQDKETLKDSKMVNSNIETKKGDNEISQIEVQNCNWPIDTIIDKQILLVELTDQELNEIGIVKYGNVIYYNNLRSNGRIIRIESSSENIPEEKKVQTNYDFTGYLIQQ